MNQKSMKMKSVQAMHLYVLETNAVAVKRNYYPFVPVINDTLIRTLTRGGPSTLSFQKLSIDLIPLHMNVKLNYKHAQLLIVTLKWSRSV